MKINSNTQANSLQGLSSQFLRLQKQRQAAREQSAQNAQSFTPPFENRKLAAVQTKAQVVPVAQAETTKSAAPAPVASDNVSLSSKAVEAQKLAQATATQAAVQTTKSVKVDDAAPAVKPSAQSASTPPTFTQKDVELFQNSFGAATGDERFNATYDLDGNGSINTLDLVRLLGRIG